MNPDGSRQLHLLTRPDDELARAVIEAQRRQGEVVVLDLTASGDAEATGQPDYDAVLQAIFAADSVAVW